MDNALWRAELDNILANAFKVESQDEALFIFLSTNHNCVYIHAPWTDIYKPIGKAYTWLGDIVTNFTKNGIPTNVTLSESRRIISSKSLYNASKIYNDDVPVDTENLEADVYLFSIDLCYRLTYYSDLILE